MNSDLKLSKLHLKQLFNFATSYTHFLFNGCFYHQINGVARGSSLAPVLANFFMGHYERLRISRIPDTLFPGIREIREGRSVSRLFLTILARFTGWNAG